MISEFLRILRVAHTWQHYDNLSPALALGEVKEEISEYEEASTHLEKLDELGDVLVNTVRVMVGLTQEELEFVCQVAEMKARRRLLFKPANKDKPAEAIEAKEIAKKLGL